MADDRKTKSVGFLFFIVHKTVCIKIEAVNKREILN